MVAPEVGGRAGARFNYIITELRPRQARSLFTTLFSPDSASSGTAALCLAVSEQGLELPQNTWKWYRVDTPELPEYSIN